MQFSQHRRQTIMFDPYHKWLGIPKDQRPPTYYQLLGLAAGESDVEVIEEAAIRQSGHLRAYQLGPHAELSTRLLNEIAQARATLIDPAKRQRYDQTVLKKAIVAVTAAAPMDTAFQDLDGNGARVIPRPKLIDIKKPGTSAAGLWIGAGIAALLSVVALAVALVFMGRRPAEEKPGPNPLPPVVVKGDGDPAPRPARERLLAEAAAYWKLGTGPKHPDFPLLTAGQVEFDVPAEGPGARADAKVARLSVGYFDAGRALSPSGAALTVYLRLRDPNGRWDAGLFSKRGNMLQVAFHLAGGASPAGPSVVFEMRTDTGYARASFPATSIDARSWHDLVGRYDGQKLQIICDGKVLDEKPLSGAIKQNKEEVLIGAETVNGRAVRPFTGDLEEAALWNRALSDDEIARLARTDKLVVALVGPPSPPPPVPGAGLVEVKPGEIYRNGADAQFIAITPDGRHALFQQPRGITVWGIAENRELRVLPMINAPAALAAVSPDSRWLAVASVSKVLVWNLQTGQTLPEIRHKGTVSALAFSEEGLLATAVGTQIQLWDVARGAMKQTLTGLERPAYSLGFDGDALWSFIGRQLQPWDLKTGQPGEARKLNTLGLRVRFVPELREVAFVSTTRVLAQSLQTGQEARGAAVGPPYNQSPVFVMTPDGRLALVAHRDPYHIGVYDLAKGVRLKNLEGHATTIRAVAVTPDGRRAFSIDQQRLMHIWNLEDVTGNLAPPPAKAETKPAPKVDAARFIPEWESLKCPSFCSIAVTPDSARAVTAGPGVDVWDLGAGKHLRNLLTPRQSVAGSVCLSPDGSKALAVAGDHVVRLWDIDTGKLIASHEYQPGMRPSCIAWSANGQHLAVANNRFIDFLDADTLRPKHTVDNGGDFGSVHTMAFFSDGQLLVYGMDNGAIRTCHSNGTKAQTAFNHTAGGRVNQLIGVKEWVLSVGLDKGFYIWDTAPRPRLLARHDQKANVRALAASPSGTYAVTGGDDHKIRFWALTTDRVLQSYAADGAIRALAYAPNGRFFLSASDDGLLRAWKLPKEIVKSD
jgi:WD40 repeat protein